MEIADFDRWREQYDEMSYTQQLIFYDQVENDHPRQSSFDLEAWRRFFAYIDGVLVGAYRIIEIGGWKGEMANEIIDHYPAIDEWINYEISREARSKTVCLSPRYRVIVLNDYIWNIPLPGASVFVASHMIEHIREWQLIKLLDNLPDNVQFIGLEAPINESDISRDWAGYHGSHILEVGWQQIIDYLRMNNFELIPELTAGHFRAFRKYANIRNYTGLEQIRLDEPILASELETIPA